MVTHVATTQSFHLAQNTATKPETPFFAVSLLKLIALSLCTNNLYQVYWFYQNWRLIKDRENLDISPFWRTFFGFIYFFDMFTGIRDYAKQKGIAFNFHPGILALSCMFVPVCVGLLPSPYWLIIYISVVFLLPVQAAVNRINRSVVPDHDPNSRFSFWNWIVIVIGGLWIVLVVIGSFLPKQ